MSRAARLRRWVGSISMSMGLCCLVLAAGLYGFRRTMEDRRPLSGPVILEVTRGSSLREIAQLALEKKLIERAEHLEILARLQGVGNRLKAGTYRFEGSVSVREILGRLEEGREALFPLTVPEGLTLLEVARLVEEAGFHDAEEFLLAATDPALPADLGIRARNLEGYLFPETYHFRRHASPREILTTMTRRFRQVWEEERRQHEPPEGYTPQEILVIASIVEKETGHDEERPLVAAVNYNRLERRMRLQSDPTVIYGLRGFDGNLTREHLETDGPYNTYRRFGLPPGPICNPGRLSLRAALEPADTDHLFFVSRGDGTHEFNHSYKEHEQAVRRYQLGGSARPRE